jgi:tape measure domain-containing protein
MANLTDSIKLNTEVDLNGLINLIQEFKDLGIKVKDVAAASRALTEQIKRDNLEQVNSIKLTVLENAKNREELINYEKVQQQTSKSDTERSKKKTAEITTERVARKNLSEELLADSVVQRGINAAEKSESDKKIAKINEERVTRKNLSEELLADSVIQRGINATETSESNKKIAKINEERVARNNSNEELLANSVVQRGLNAAEISESNKKIAAEKVLISESQKKREIVKLSIDEQNLYNAQLRNQALKTAEVKEESDKLSKSITSLTNIGTGFLAIFGIDTLGSFSQSMIDAQSKVQAFGLSMKNLIGNAYGEKLVNDLKQFTIETPLNFEDVIQSTNQLVGSFKAAGASSKTIGTEIPQILESIGNSAAALGGDDRMGRLVYAFSQVQATGRLMGTEVRQITETGFPMLAVLTQSLNERFPELALSVSDVQKRLSDGKVSFEDFKIALLSAGEAGGVFAGGMEARMTTVAGSLDKLKESVFFALSNIGNQFNDTAKSVIDFGMSMVKSLFGTESAAQRTVDVVSNLTKIYLGYRVAIAAVATATALKDAYDKVSLITQGLLMRSKALLNGESQKFITLMAEETLAKNINTGATVGTTAAIEVMTVAEAEAAIATRSLTAAFGVIAIVLGVAYAAYEIYKSTVEDTDAKQKELNDRMALGIAPIRESQSEFNRLANALKKSSDATQEKTTKLEALKAKFPEQLKGINDLATAEKLLGDKANDTNIVKDYRLKLFNQLKTKFPEQTKGLKDVNYSETELSKIMKEVNGDFLIRQQLMKDEIALNMNKEKINIWLKEQIKLEGELATASTKSTYMVTGTAGRIEEIASERSEIEKAIAARGRWVLNAQQTNAKIAENSIETTKKLKFNWEEQNKNANKAGEEGKEIALKYKADTDKQKAILDQTNALREEQKTRENQQKILNLEKQYDELRVVNAKGSQTVKVKELEKIQTKYREDSANLTREWDKKDIELSEKFWKDIEKVEKETQEDRVKFSKAIDKILEDAKEESEKNKIKIAEKYAKDLQKADEDNLKESAKLLDKKYNLMDSLRLLDKISHAKTAKEITEIEKQENLKVLEDIKNSINQQLVLAKLRLERLRQEKGESSLEYKSYFNNVLVLEQQYTDASAKILDEQSNQLKANMIKKEKIVEEALDIMYQAGKNVLSDIFSIKQEKLSEDLKKAETELDKFRIRQQQKDLDTEQKTIGFFTALASGNWVQSISSLVSVIGDLSRDTTLERQAALLEDQLNSLREIMGIIDSSLNSIGSSFDSISSVYGGIFDVSKLQQFTDMSNKSIEERIQAEIKHGEQITENYNKAVSKENDRYNKEIDNIEKAFDLQVKKINDKYNLIDLKAQQAYNSETLSITSAGSSQLEALIKNEESLSSVRAEFAQKRLDIENAFPLANKAITKDMSKSEIDAINASIDARDKSFAKLQGWYNQELVAIVNSEGQKRKEYTATEVIQNDINSKLELAAIKFQADEIQRAKDRADAILLQEKDKQDKIESQTLIHNNNLIKLESDKNIAIINSFSDLKLLLQAQIYQITGAMVDSANISTEAFQKLKIQLEEISNLYRALSNGTSPPTIVIPIIDIPRIPTGFEKGTDDTSVALKGQRVVDNKGGWQAILHPQEAVFSKADMTQMETVFGKRPTRQEVIENFKIGVVNQVTPQMNPFVIQKVQANGIGNFDKLSGEIRSLAKEVSKKMSPVVYVDKGGIRTFYKNLNSQIEVKNQRFK